MAQNHAAAEEFVRSLGAPGESRTGGTRVWRNVAPQRITDLLGRFVVHPDSRKANTKLLMEYINAQVAQDELLSWTVGLMSVSAGSAVRFADFEVRLSSRTPADTTDATRYCLRKGRLLNRTDEALDLGPDELPADLRIEELTPPDIRDRRPKARGLMLIYLLDSRLPDQRVPFVGLFFSFPGSPTAKTITYRVNNVYWEQEFDS